MADNTISVDLELKKDGVEKGLKDVENAAGKTGDSIAKGVFKGNAAYDLFKKSLSVVADSFSEAIHAATQYETVVNSLNIALASSGQFSKEASDGFREWAGQLQSTTKFSDDQVLSSSALIQNLAKLSNEGLKKATEASLNLSSALGIDLNAASLLVGKAANGNVAAFSRYGIEIKKGKTDTETFANTLNKLASSFPNAAEAAAKSFAGSTSQLKNAFDDIFKELGRSITKSPAIIAIVGEFTKIFAAVGETIKRALGSTDIFKPLLSNLITVAGFLTSTFGPVLESIGRIGYAVFESLSLGIKTIYTGFLGVGAVIEKMLNALHISDSTFFADETKKSFDSLAVSADDTAKSITDSLGSQGTMTTSVLDTLSSMQGAVDITSGKLKEFSDGVNNIPQSFQLATVAMSDLNTSLQEGLWPGLEFTGTVTADMAKKSEDAKVKMVESFKQIGASARQGVGSAVGSGFASFGKALASGENAVKAFANAFLGAIGGMLVQLGTSYILQGIAASANPLTPGIGGPLIAAGAAMATFGGVLQALSGGGGGGVAAAGGGGGGDTGSSNAPAPATGFNEQVKTQAPAVTVNVQGNILDRRETGLELISMINESFDAQGYATV